ncbi:hypothetical protein N6H18_09160 [Reichenbachiella agarivorans]|uniref:Uncharacterized protein n=1 Tax=Reichenbachiella agarivorans TaxID=2979464 RepID=A0ABY6CUC2_9BACT|nr:hypothetical protein [Reichenbachiella agarivorans]UXP34111.1 hypothetical protein N6H18_09160 [Reichenbachiella agarivorans]
MKALFALCLPSISATYIPLIIELSDHSTQDDRPPFIFLYQSCWSFGLENAVIKRFSIHDAYNWYVWMLDIMLATLLQIAGDYTF